MEKTRSGFKNNPVFWSSLAGIFLGILFLIPYLFLTYSVFWFIETGEASLHGPIYLEGPKAFRFFLLSISLSFVLSGGFIGFAFGKWYDRRKQHIQEQIEHEKKATALEILKELNVTLSHYIINSSSIIKGFAQRGSKKAKDDNIRKYFIIIQEEIDKTIAVMKGLSNLKEIETKKYIEPGTILMIDLKKQLQEQLEKLDAIQDDDQLFK